MTQPSYDGPPDYRAVGRHEVFPETTHDQTERLQLSRPSESHLAQSMMPGVAEAYAARVERPFGRRYGRPPRHRREVRKALAADPLHQTWSALRRNTMEMRQQAGLSVVLPQLGELISKTQRLVPQGHLRLKPDLPTPEYLTAVDHHCMPGSYYAEHTADDVSGAAQLRLRHVRHHGRPVGPLHRRRRTRRR